ncbi:MAG: hypothetical protein LBT20_01540 [Clostridiales bacterium]|nr:hypothetical protein [Clostridiales bacterium]
MLTDKVFINFEDCRAQLKQVGQDASDFFTTNITSGAGLQVMNEGRAKFIDFVKNITDEQLESVVELPYGRKLSNEESKMIREKLLQVWNFDGDYWNPLTDNYKGEILVVISEFITDKDIEKIQSFLNVDNINHCYAVDENKNDYECGYISVTSCEEVCVDKRLDWLIYSSHEGTVSFAGTPLIAFVKELFIDRKEQLWHGW